MSTQLRFDDKNYSVKTCEMGGKTITYRAFMDIKYCENPLNPIQKMNIFVPETYYNKGQVNGYTLKTAPIFMPNTVGGYMPGPSDEPGLDFKKQINSIFYALEHGYVVASAGVRGRTSGKVSNEFFVGGKDTKDSTESATGRIVGKAPALIVDMKAAIRYLRHNADVVPGNTERIITNGTSAGGALSALAGATGNSADYEPYLKEIGAADERDDVYAASCYCPIHNLEHADAAYEWLFCGHKDFHKIKRVKTDHGVERVPVSGEMTDKQMELSKELKALFPEYVNSLHLNDDDGNELSLDADGNGSFRDYVRDYVIKSAEKELETHDSEMRLPQLAVAGSEVEKQSYLTIEGGKVTGFDWDGYVTAITRMKATPAFDALDLNSPENDEFGTEEVEAKHFTAFSYEHTEANGEMADGRVIKMLNPLSYIGEADTAKYWRIRHGAYDRDTAIAIPAILATTLKNKGYSVDFHFPWGLPHSGDYDLEELFAWIDSIV